MAVSAIHQQSEKEFAQIHASKVWMPDQHLLHQLHHKKTVAIVRAIPLNFLSGYANSGNFVTDLKFSMDCDGVGSLIWVVTNEWSLNSVNFCTRELNERSYRLEETKIWSIRAFFTFVTCGFGLHFERGVITCVTPESGVQSETQFLRVGNFKVKITK